MSVLKISRNSNLFYNKHLALRNIQLSAGTANPTNWVRQNNLEELKEAILELRNEVEARQFEMEENWSQDLLSNLVLGGMILCSAVGTLVYGSKHYILNKLRKNEERIEHRRAIPLEHYAV